MTNLETLKKVVFLFDSITEPEDVDEIFRFSFFMVKSSLHSLLAQCRFYEIAESIKQSSS